MRGIKDWYYKNTKNPEYDVHGGTLRFRNDKTERKYTHYRGIKSVVFIRFGFLLGALCFGLFSIVDYFVINDIATYSIASRLLVTCPFCIGISLLTYKKSFVRYAEQIISFATALAGLSVVLMAVFSQSDGAYLYYAGIIMVIYFPSIFQMRFTTAFWLASLFIVSYSILTAILKDMPMLYWINNLAFLVTATSLATITSYFPELKNRQEFTARMLARENELKSRKAKEFAEAANRAKTEFLTIMNHEFRTPLTAIRGNAEMIDMEIFGSMAENRAQYMELAGHIKKSSMHLLELINQTLDIAKNNAGMLSVQEHAFDLVRMLQDSLSLMDGYEADKHIHLVFESTLEEAMFNGDEQRLKQAIVNLLSNAIKFSKTGQTVTVILERTDDGYAVMVRDEGAGIPDDDQEKIFRPFEQSRNAMTRKHDGTGLGLPFVKQITELHRGTVTLHSTLGKGTMVRVTLPVLRKVVL